jgi:L-asparaginase II
LSKTNPILQIKPMPTINHQPLFELTRGEVVESMHVGSVAVVDPQGELVAWYGDAYHVTYLRSTAKPFQALPFVEGGGPAKYDLSLTEIALLCASHSGTDEHVSTLKSLQDKTGVLESDLVCGVHEPYDEATGEAMHLRGEKPTSNRHNCSGKHTGMLAQAQFHGWPKTNYIDPHHPVQELILKTFSEITGTAEEQIQVGIDGCSAPNFAIPLYNTALAFARLCDPEGLSPQRANACKTIVQAMCAAPSMVAGPGRFDTEVMEIAAGRLISKGGAEGYQGIGLLPEAINPGSKALGIAFKIGDGDLRSRARPPVAIEILRQLGALNHSEVERLEKFGPISPIINWMEIVVGEARPSFELNKN